MKQLALAALCACACLAAQAETLWGKVAIGDSVEAVKSAYPNGLEIAPNAANVVKRTGAMLLYKISGVEVNQDSFSASFSFTKDGLAQVTLNSNPTVGQRQCFSKFQQLVEAMKSKYGAPLSADFSSSFLKTALFQSGNVSARVDGMAGSADCSLSIYYTTSVSEAAKNL